MPKKQNSRILTIVVVIEEKPHCQCEYENWIKRWLSRKLCRKPTPNVIQLFILRALFVAYRHRIPDSHSGWNCAHKIQTSICGASHTNAHAHNIYIIYAAHHIGLRAWIQPNFRNRDILVAKHSTQILWIELFLADKM